MNIRVTSWKIWLPCLAQAAAALAAPPHYLASREIVLDCRPTNGVPVDEVRVWLSTDVGRTWRAVEITRDGQHSLRYSAPADGRYDYYVVLRNAAGSSADPPGPGARPMTTIIVDTLPPLLQIHGAEAERTADGLLKVSLKTTLVDENLSTTGVRLFQRDGAQHWVDAGPGTILDDRLVACLPECGQAALNLRVVATDLAGNTATAETLDVRIPPPAEIAPEPAAANEPAEPPPPPADPPPLELPADAQRLRNLARSFMAEGRYSLAAARLEDAVSRAPRDADLLVDLGNALYRAGRYDEAGQRLQAALQAQPDHADALDGLALVAVTQKQYSQAHEYMLQLQRLRPQSGLVWLRSGDIEHRLGNLAPALAAWRKALAADDTDQNLRDNARRRLDYFDPARATGSRPSTGEPWQEPPRPRPRPSSSSSETTSTRKPPP
jgi:Flp pilus assembly protein TadD